MIRISPFRFDFFERSDSEIPRLQYFSLEVELNKWRYDFTADTFLLLSSEYATLKTPGDCEIILMQNNSRSNSTISNPQLPKFFKFWFYSKLYFLISSVASESFFSNSQLLLSHHLFYEIVSSRSRFFLWRFNDFFCCCWGTQMFSTEFDDRIRLVIVFGFHQHSFLAVNGKHFQFSAENIFCFHRRTYFVFTSIYFKVSTKIIFCFHPKSILVDTLKSILVVIRNHFLLSPKINFGCHRNSFLVVIRNLFLLTTQINFSLHQTTLLGGISC